MNVLLYYVLRRFFAAIRFEKDLVHIEKGFFIRRVSEIPISRLTKITVRRTPLLRLLRGKRITLDTYGGSVSFYLKKDEPTPYLPKAAGIPITPTRLSALFGAFVDTRALSGAAAFSVTVSRIGSVLGSEYYDEIMNAIAGAADELHSTLKTFNIAIPRIAAMIAVFVLAAWVFAFIRRAAEQRGFCLRADRKYLTVERGLLTLYEYTLVLDDLNAVVSCDTVTTLFFGASPIYCRGAMVFPPVRKETAERLTRLILGCRPDTAKTSVKPPPRALFGHCAAPLGWLGGFSAGLALAFFAREYGYVNDLPLLRSVLWCGAAISAWCVFVGAVYMFRSELILGERLAAVRARRTARLYTVTFSVGTARERTVMQTPFQKRSGLCDLGVCLMGKLRAKLRQIPLRALREIGGYR